MRDCNRQRLTLKLDIAMKSKIIIYALLIFGPLSAMHVPLPMATPGANEEQPQFKCPGHQLEHQPDDRKGVKYQGRWYYCIEGDGKGLSAHDVERLRQIVPFAIERMRDEIRFKNKLWTFGVAGFAVPFLLSAWIGFSACHHLPLLRRALETLKVAFGMGVNCSALCLGYVSRLCNPLRRDREQETNLIAEIATEMFTASDKPCPLSKLKDCPPENQKIHLQEVQCERMAFRGLFFPAAARKQIEKEPCSRKPLETFLLQADSPVNDLLQISPEYRGNKNFVTEMMKFIEECSRW